MSLKENWVDKIDGKDYVKAKDINDIAHANIDLEKRVFSIEKIFVTPEMFGAVGDGVTDDTEAFTAFQNSSHNILIGGCNKKYRITRVDLNEKTVVNTNFFTNSSTELSGFLFAVNCCFEKCAFESVNDKTSSWSNMTDKVSNRHIVANNTTFDGCSFINIEHVSLGESDQCALVNCTWDGCPSGVTGNYAKNVVVKDCVMNLLSNTSSLHHAIYASNDCENWLVDHVTVYNANYQPITAYNSNNYGENPKNITVRNSYFYGLTNFISSNCENLVVDNCTTDGNIERYIFGGGSVTLRNMTVNTTSLFHATSSTATTFENGETYYNKIILENCVITSSWTLIYPYRDAVPEIVQTANIESRNCTYNCGTFSDSNPVNLHSFNDVFNVRSKFFDDVYGIDLGATLEQKKFTALFKGCVFNLAENGLIMESSNGFIDMIDCAIYKDAASIVFLYRVDPTENIVLNLSNITFNKAGVWIYSTITEGFRHNLFNEKNYTATT